MLTNQQHQEANKLSNQLSPTLSHARGCNDIAAAVMETVNGTGERSLSNNKGIQQSTNFSSGSIHSFRRRPLT